MNILNAIAAALRADGDTVYINRAPQEAAAPFLVYNVVGGVDDRDLVAVNGARTRLVQVDAYAQTAKDANALIERAASKMETSSKFVVEQTAVSGGTGFEPETDLERDSREFWIWYQA